MNRDFYDRFMRVQHIIEETPETKSFSLDLASEPFRFKSGQFVNVTAQLPDQRRVRRAYSIASSPLDSELLLTVKRIPNGLLSNFLCDDVKPGDALHIRGPYGRFTLEGDGQPPVFIAAGSGIVPFRSMWRYICQTGSKSTFSVLYASKSHARVIYRDELTQLTKAGYRIVLTMTRKDDPLWTGYSRRIDRDMLVEVVGHFEGKLFYICGPPVFCDCVAADLQSLGVPRDLVKTEKYD